MNTQKTATQPQGGKVSKKIEAIKSEVLVNKVTSKVISKPFIMQRSNHTARIEKYVQKFAPAMSVLDCIKIENLLGYNDKEINITYNRSLKEFTKGWLLAHGDESRLFSIKLFHCAMAMALPFLLICSFVFFNPMRQSFVVGKDARMSPKVGIPRHNACLVVELVYTVFGFREVHYLRLGLLRGFFLIGFLPVAFDLIFCLEFRLSSRD